MTIAMGQLPLHMKEAYTLVKKSIKRCLLALKRAILSKKCLEIIIFSSAGIALYLLKRHMDKVELWKLIHKYTSFSVPILHEQQPVGYQKFEKPATSWDALTLDDSTISHLNFISFSFPSFTAPSQDSQDPPWSDAYFEKNKYAAVKRHQNTMRFGYPSLNSIGWYDNFVMSYDKKHKIPHWVYERIVADKVKTTPDLSTLKPKEDEKIHPYFRSNESAFKVPGYSKIHLAAVENHQSNRVHLANTYLLSNMVPHRGIPVKAKNIWRQLEEHIRTLPNTYKNVYCCSGTLFLPSKDKDGNSFVKYELLGNNDVGVPTHLFKVVMVESKKNKLEMFCYLLSNKVDSDIFTPLEMFYVEPTVLEKISGLLFLDGISLIRFRKINGQPNPLRA